MTSTVRLQGHVISCGAFTVSRRACWVNRLGQMHEKHSKDQTGTLITGPGHGVDLADNKLSSLVEKLCVRSRGTDCKITGFPVHCYTHEHVLAGISEGV